MIAPVARISISAGVPNSALDQYFQVKDAVIAHNTIVNSPVPRSRLTMDLEAVVERC